MAVTSGKNLTGSTSKGVADFLAADLPPDLIDGKYEVNISYHLPGKDIVTLTVTKELELK